MSRASRCAPLTDARRSPGLHGPGLRTSVRVQHGAHDPRRARTRAEACLSEDRPVLSTWCPCLYNSVAKPPFGLDGVYSAFPARAPAASCGWLPIVWRPRSLAFRRPPHSQLIHGRRASMGPCTMYCVAHVPWLSVLIAPFRRGGARAVRAVQLRRRTARDTSTARPKG